MRNVYGRDVVNGSNTFFSEIISWAAHRGFEVEKAGSEVLLIKLKGRVAAMVDESGVLAYHPFGKAHDILDEITNIRKSIPREENDGVFKY